MAGMRDERGLTAKQAKFAECVSKGMSLTDSYKASHETRNMKPKTIRTKSSALIKREVIRAAVEAERMERDRIVDTLTINDRDMLLTHLRDWAQGKVEATATQLRAAELLGKACGLYREVVEDHRERPAQVVAAELESRLAGLLDRINGSPDDEGSGEQDDSTDEVEGEGEPGAVEPGEGGSFH